MYLIPFSVLEQSSLNLRFLIFSRPYCTVQVGYALNGRVRRSSVIMD